MEVNAISLLLAGAPACLIVAFLCIRLKRSFWKTLVSLLFIAYIGVVLALTLFPLPVYLHEGQPYYDRGYNLVPFKEITATVTQYAGSSQYWWIPIYLIGGNLALLAPLGLMVPYLFKKLSPTKKAIVFFLCAAVSIEVTQLLIGVRVGYLYRNVDVDDVMLNFTGALVGYALYKIGHAVIAKRHAGDNVQE